MLRLFFILVTNDDNSCTIIGRSGSDRIDAGAILARFGGGGHPGAASATVRKPDIDPCSLKSDLINIIKNNKIISATVADLMSYPVVIVPAGTTMKRVREVMEEHSIRGVLVGTLDAPEGIIVLSDMNKLKQERQWNTPVKAFMARNLCFIKPNVDPAEAALNLWYQKTSATFLSSTKEKLSESLPEQISSHTFMICCQIK